MLYRSNVFRFLMSFLLITMLVSLGLADTIRLKDGSIIKGRIESFIGGKFVVAMGEGSRRKQLTFLASEIESIEFDAPISPPEFTTATTQNVTFKKPVTIPNVQPNVVAPADSTKINNPQPPANGSGGKMKPIEWQIKVLADNTANGWTNSGWVVKKDSGFASPVTAWFHWEKARLQPHPACPQSMTTVSCCRMSRPER